MTAYAHLMFTHIQTCGFTNVKVLFVSYKIYFCSFSMTAKLLQALFPFIFPIFLAFWRPTSIHYLIKLCPQHPVNSARLHCTPAFQHATQQMGTRGRILKVNINCTVSNSNSQRINCTKHGLKIIVVFLQSSKLPKH